MSVFHQSHLKNDVQVSLLCTCLCWEMKEILECPMWKLETRSMFETVGEKELSKTDVIQLTGLFCSWLWPFMLNDFYLKTSFPRLMSSWWPKEVLEAGQPLTPGLVFPCPGLHRLHTDGSIPAGAPTSESRWQWAALPATSLMALLPTSLKISTIIPLFAFHLPKICLLVYHGGAEQENDCMHSCSSYSLDIPCQLHRTLLTAKMQADRHVVNCLLNSVKVV